ncbi:MAG TPA: GTP-binding protein [Lachnospiraceae bacterium]|nr:GTP-binding protein [Lachnospiraceae bacterium]
MDIISGFLGAGKTTLIKKLLEEAFADENVVLIENEFGEVGIDGPLLKEYGVEIREMNSGCICCTIAGDFSLALKELLAMYHPDRIIIEPSGVGKLSDVIGGCKKYLKDGEVELNMCITVIDALKYRVYLKNFTEFYKNQLEHAKTIILSRTRNTSSKVIEAVLADILNYNPKAHVVTTDWNDLSGRKIVDLAEIAEEIQGLSDLLKQSACGCAHEGGMHHHADEVFRVWGTETAKMFTRDRLEEILHGLKDTEGTVLRAKGIVGTEDGSWLQFDYVPEEESVRETIPECVGRICVIGERINEELLTELFEVQR